MHHLTKVFSLLAIIALASHASLYLSFKNFTSGSGFPLSQIFGSVYHKEMSNGTWTYLNHFTCDARDECWQKVCHASSITHANEICLTPVVSSDSRSCDTNQRLPKEITLVLEFLLILELIYFPFLVLRNGPFSWTRGESRDRVLVSYRFILFTTITTSVLIVIITSIFLMTLSSVPFWVWVNQLYQSINLSLIITALLNQPPILEDEEEKPLISDKETTIQ